MSFFTNLKSKTGQQIPNWQGFTNCANTLWYIFVLWQQYINYALN